MAARPLRDVFAELAGDPDARAADPAAVLRASGHDDLPDELVAEAVISFADTAPVEVAEHLAPYVGTHGPVPVGGDTAPLSWLEALATAPPMGTLEAHDPSEGLDDASAADASEPMDTVARHRDTLADGEPDDLDFGQGLSGAPRADATGGDLTADLGDSTVDELDADYGRVAPMPNATVAEPDPHVLPSPLTEYSADPEYVADPGVDSDLGDLS